MRPNENIEIQESTCSVFSCNADDDNCETYKDKSNDYYEDEYRDDTYVYKDFDRLAYEYRNYSNRLFDEFMLGDEKDLAKCIKNFSNRYSRRINHITGNTIVLNLERRLAFTEKFGSLLVKSDDEDISKSYPEGMLTNYGKLCTFAYEDFTEGYPDYYYYSLYLYRS